jgi:hypothetical protein
VLIYWCGRFPAGSPRRGGPYIFCSDVLYNLDLEVALGEQLLQPRILVLDLPQTRYVHRIKLAEAPAPT